MGNLYGREYYHKAVSAALQVVKSLMHEAFSLSCEQVGTGAVSRVVPATRISSDLQDAPLHPYLF